MADFNLGLYPISNPGVGIYNGVSPLVDGAGNTYIAFASQQPHPGENITTVEVYKYAPDGTQLEHHKVHPPGTFKINDVGLTHSGTNLIVAAVMHTPGANDEVGVASVAIPGYAVRQGMETEEGAAGAFNPDGGNDVGITKDDVKAAVREVIGIGEGRTLGDDWGAHHQPAPHADSYDWRQVLEDKNKSAISESSVTTTGNIKDTLYQFTKDREYEVFEQNAPGFWAWLRTKVAGGK